ncbi:hypothetical protein JHK87_009930 [Glycine soja]|uniref:ATP-dependent DNA helicase n=1 Tax=Glycine max TaxID=3847 RepID=A0A0R0KCT5_SOYBN|nr:hypothetical protein JHK87_009930 [Glycine soja]KAG5066326.1 hypothetical protein JHK86_010057 [Glycine max]
MFIAWFEANKMYEEGKNLTYAKFPTRFVYIKQKRREYINLIKEASELTFGFQLRKLFATLLVMNTMSKPNFCYNYTILSFCAYLQIAKNDLKNLCFIELEKLLMKNGRSFENYGSMKEPRKHFFVKLSTKIKLKGMIVLNVASNGIASLLLLGGRTTHSTVCFPLLINEESTCNMKQRSLKAKLLLQTKLIIWDETPMINRYCFEAFDRTLRDIMRSKNDDNNVQLQSNQNPDDIKVFADWIIQIGDRDINGKTKIYIHEDLLISECESPLLSLVEFTYPNILQNVNTPTFFEERTILRNLETIDNVNDLILSLIPRDEVHYLRISKHKLRLKVRVSVILLITVIIGKNVGDKILILRMDLIPSNPGIPFMFKRRQFLVFLSFAMTINKSQGQSLSKIYVATSQVKSKKGLKILILEDDGQLCFSTKNVVYREVFENF